MYHRKDASLDILAQSGNVAQFVSYEPTASGTLRQTFSRVLGHEPNHPFSGVEDAIASLLQQASDGSVNVRSFAPDSPRSHEFIYGLTSMSDAAEAVHRLSAGGLHVIINETIDISDGGVSGVVQGDVIEFAPDDTPRCVEKPGVASLPLDMGLELLELVYGFRPDLPRTNGRVEFSIHPKPRGWLADHTLLWELEETPSGVALPHLNWPNRFSRHIGDKAYGLAMAHLSGFAVPSTEVIARRIAPFRFGQTTGSREIWLRTAPSEQEPGLFTTRKGWIDPFALLAREDPNQSRISSILAQNAVRAAHSGAALVDGDGRIVVEGVAGEGDAFMLGNATMTDLPEPVVADVAKLIERLMDRFGPTRIEWVHDGTKAWIVQMHMGGTASVPAMLVPGERENWVDFPIEGGLEALRRLLTTLEDDTGVRLLGRIGMTSHIADLARKSGVPTRVVGSRVPVSDDRIRIPSSD